MIRCNEPGKLLLREEGNQLSGEMVDSKTNNVRGPDCGSVI